MKNIITFVIRTKNEDEFLEETLKRIRNQKGNISSQIIIVDSGSTDNTLSIANKYADKIIHIKPEAFTWGYALNRGIREAEGEYVCLISGHCLLQNDYTLERAYEFIRSSDYCCIYGKQIGNQALDKLECLELYDIYGDIYSTDSNMGRVTGVSNACCMIKKDIWDKIKFDEDVLSAEDGIWYKNALEHGLKVAYYSEFCVIHGHHFNVQYMYRKWYWRTYEFEIIEERNVNLKTANYFRFFLSFIKTMVIGMANFRKYAKKLNIKVTSGARFKYFLIRNTAAFMAKMDLKRKECAEQFNDIKVPSILIRIKIRPGEFHEI